MLDTLAPTADIFGAGPGDLDGAKEHDGQPPRLGIMPQPWLCCCCCHNLSLQRHSCIRLKPATSLGDDFALGLSLGSDSLFDYLGCVMTQVVLQSYEYMDMSACLGSGFAHSALSTMIDWTQHADQAQLLPSR